MSDNKNQSEGQSSLRRSSRSTRGSVKPVVNLTKQPELSEDEVEDDSAASKSKKVIKSEKKGKEEEVLVLSSDDGDDDADFEVPTSKGRRSSATGTRRKQSTATTKGNKLQSSVPAEKAVVKRAVAPKTSVSKKKSIKTEAKKDKKQEDSVSDIDNPADFCYELNTNEMKEVNNAFDLNCSQDGEELLSSDDLKTAIRSLGFEPRADEIHNLLKKFANTTGKINRDSFHKIMALKMGSSPGAGDKCFNDEISKVFNLLDLDKTGAITLENLRSIAKELNEELTDEELHEMIVEADLDGDYQINKQEFYNIMKKTSLY